MKIEHFELIWGKKAAEICERIFSFRQRFPKIFRDELIEEIGPFFSACPKELLETHDLFILRCIFFHHCRVILRAEKKPTERIHLNVLKLGPSRYGLIIALASLSEQELFGQRHIQKGVQNIIPGIKPIISSYFKRRRGDFHLYYLEIKKVRGGIFRESEKAKLHFDLPLEFLQRIELISQSLFLPGNEEEIFKNIRHLTCELRSSNDLPQVMINFVEYINGTLKFLVICLRVVKEHTDSLDSALLPSLVRFSLENLFCVEKLKKSTKEAAIFTLEVSSSLFLRNKNSVNLRAARQYITKALESMIGPFRDYNGGLLSQENRQLFEIKRILEKKGLFFHGIEDFFYGIKPISLRATFSTQVACQFVEMIQKMAACPLSESKKYHLELLVAQRAHLVVIQTRDRKWKNVLPKKILAESARIGYSYSEDDHYLYLCFFVESPSDSSMFKAIHKQLTENSWLSSENGRDVLRLNFQGGEPPSLNPRFAADLHSNVLAGLLFEGLTRFTKAGKVECAVAEKIDISECGLIYTFHLRPSWWSCGEELTAYDFERTWKKALMADCAACIKPDFFFSIKNAQKAREHRCSLKEVGIQTVDPQTLRVELKEPCSYFLNLLASPSFFPLYGEDEEPTVFNGPFILAEWKQDHHLTLSQNPFYWNAREIKLSGVLISMIRDPFAAYDMFLKGGLDLIGDPVSPLPPKMLEFLEDQKILVQNPISRVFWVHCNLQSFPLNNDKVRRALSLAINRKQLVEKVFIFQIPHFSPLPLQYSHSSGPIEGDPKLAREYFQEALHELNIDGEDFPVLEMIHSNLSFEKPLADELKSQLRQVLGIHIHSRALPWSEFSSALERGDFQLGGLFRRDLFNNPMFYLNFFKKSQGNIHSWENKEYEALLTHFQSEEENIKKIEKLLIEKAPVIPLVNQNNLMLIKDRVKGLDWKQDGLLDLKRVTINHETSIKICSTSHSDCIHRVSTE